MQANETDSSVTSIQRPGRRRTTRSEGELTHKRMGELMLVESDTDSATSNDRGQKGRKRKAKALHGPQKSSKVSAAGGRRSGRSLEQQIYLDSQDDTDLLTESETGTPKAQPNSQPRKKAVKEVFRNDYSSEWEDRHWDVCEVCRNTDNRKLIYCQGCAVAVHQECLGGRSERKHHVTRLDVDDYVLQCRHCMGKGGQRGGNRSYVTGKVGPLCTPFPKLYVDNPKDEATLNEVERAAQAEEEARLATQRDELRSKLYDPEAVMFRCNRCMRPAMYDELSDPEESSPTFEPAQCLDCNAHMDSRVHLVLGWRQLPEEKMETLEVVKRELPKDLIREYLIKWQDQSYIQTEWVSASWLHGIAPAKKNNFDARILGPITTQSDVILEDYNRVEIVLDVIYKNDKTFEEMKFTEESQACAAIGKVQKILVKWQQVQYDDISWDLPPSHDVGDSELLKHRWIAYEAAYKEWVKGFYVMVDKNHANKTIKISDVPFSRLEKKTQPKELVGGDLMPYQMEGLNWLYYSYYRNHPAILADEMGLGKTIQIISLLSVLYSDWSIAPFLIVAPNSTMSNWKREFQKWAPQMRVAAYYGERSAKDVIQEYEIVHNDIKGQPLKVHALVTSYQTIESDSTFLKKYSWACLVVDEGQRLKNDESILFKLLSEFKVNHRILLTGTPLQNNTRELFNLLQFLDPGKMDAASLEAHFDIEKQESLSELHAMLTPYFLRRTKVQVLKFLPSKNEVIVPVTMSSLQKGLYKTILSKNAELMRLVMSRASAGKAIQNYNNTSLGNVLQQIRKILSHPFIYSPDIEEQVDDEQTSLMNLTNACAKLQLLKVLLPTLKARGHRVLIFCQFIMMLDILEDWLNASEILHCRIDGHTPTPERQESIDRFNKPGSDITCFLLSTRAGGVGINLATADTVIIYDADFNPHQDLQAVARAHRIGQKNKVVVFTLVTRNTAEEKILQIGRKKMVLDQLIIENMATKEENVPYQEILSFGAAALFDEEAKNELVYDQNTVNNLIDSSYADITVEAAEEVDSEKPKDSFGFAKVWAGDSLADDNIGESAPGEVNEDLWARILQQRAAEAKAEADKKSAEFSKGRKRTVKDYSETNSGKILEASIREKAIDDKSSIVDAMEEEPQKSDVDEYSEARITDDSSDSSSLSGEEEEPLDGVVKAPTREPVGALPDRAIQGLDGVLDVLAQENADRPTLGPVTQEVAEKAKLCKVCRKVHLGGQCQIRNVPVEICTLCKTAHFSGGRKGGRICPVFSDPVAMRRVLEDLKGSNESPELVDEAKAYLRGALNAIKRKSKTNGDQLQPDRDTLMQDTNGHDAANGHTVAPV